MINIFDKNASIIFLMTILHSNFNFKPSNPLKRLPKILVTLRMNKGNDYESYKLVTLDNKMYYVTNIGHICHKHTKKFSSKDLIVQNLKSPHYPKVCKMGYFMSFYATISKTMIIMLGDIFIRKI